LLSRSLAPNTVSFRLEFCNIG